LILMARDNFRYFQRLGIPDLRALEFADAGYNGGIAGVQNERRACQISAGCDPRQWFDHVERHCLKSREALYGQRSACDINRHHVHDVTRVRAFKYRGMV
jgi:membrane-bound lytic murein transglycosylase MltF